LLKDQGFTPKKKIRLIMGCDEESGSRCLEHYFKKNPIPDLGFSPDAEFPLIYGEKAHMTYNFEGTLDDTEIITEFSCGTRYNVVPALATMRLSKDYKKEYLAFLEKNQYQGEVKNGVYTAYGTASHAMVPQNGVNASFILFEFLNEVHPSTLSQFFVRYLTFDPFGKKLGYDLYDEEMKELTSNVGLVQIKDKNILIGIDSRVPRKEHEGVMKEKIQEASKTANLKVNVLGFGGFHYVDPNSFLVTTLMKVYKEVTKDSTAEPMTIGGGTYAKFIENGVAYGPLMPGREDVCHIADEYMLLEDFKNAILIYAKAIYELTK
ncbi:MAG: Sapep family Mn(2+)-dependent dipeptidase, partial [Anaeroplasmataceae bacterium]|nr:Sapep family Mn(2+)-dependent dipeptidase [Anaeroplasmataceae bacterium]